MMATMKRSILLSFSFVVLLTAQMACGQYSNSPAIVPPAGNSPNLVVKTASSYVVYTCSNGAWVSGYGYATLLDKNTNKVVGKYTKTVDKEGELGTWAILNSPGDAAESGSSSSIVTGRTVEKAWVGSGLPQLLFEAASHENDGAASLVSYIQKYNIVGGVAPAKEKCTTQKHSVTVPFYADFCLWNQDPLPASVPESLAAPGRVVEGFFGKGTITFTYDGSAWVDTAKEAILCTIPGTPGLGHFTTANNGVETWNLYNPNGAMFYGKRASPDVVVVDNACPWSLSKITSASGPLLSLGDFSHVLTTSTRGGMAPVLNYKPVKGTTVEVPFSAIFWFYIGE